MWLKMCPKCGGDLYVREEIDGNDIVCLQCGRAWPTQTGQEDQILEFPRILEHRRIAA